MQQYCTFELGDLLLGIAARRVQEVLRWQPTTPVPLAPASVRGLMNMRGQLVLVVDLRRRFDLESADASLRQVNVLIRNDDSTTSLLVDRVGDVLELDENKFEPVPDAVRGDSRQLLLGAYQLSERLLLKLDPDRASAL